MAFNTDLQNQILQLSEILRQNHELYGIIEQARGLGLQNYYIGAGCIAQTVWNKQSGLDPAYGISDVDIAYYDSADISFEAEREVAEKISKAMPHCKFVLDIKNQARVHLWYKERFGYDIGPYDSVEGAINTWPTTATSVGVRLENGRLAIYAPYGLNDLLGMIVRANKTKITEEIYMQKVRKWSAKWPLLTIIPWLGD